MADVPLFVSRRRLARYTRLPIACTDWALDSGGFSELSLFGHWTITPEQYASEVRRYHEEVGRLQFASAMDWMCEPAILEKTGLRVEQHQGRTVACSILAFYPSLHPDEIINQVRGHWLDPVGSVREGARGGRPNA